MTNNQTSESDQCQLTPPRRSCGSSCLLLMIVFASGLLAGGGLTVIFDLDETVSKIFGLEPERKKSGSIEQLRDRITDRYTKELGLSEEMTNKVRDIITRQLSGSLKRRMETLDKLSEALYPTFNDVQKANWEKMKAESIKRWGKALTTTQPSK
ncbi:MAG: hypothetical protein GY794_01135 [bacterium]|nr:hypothetical protein [bacterium]